MSILGANGAGKTTTLLTISGLVRASGGAVRFQGEDLHTLPSHEVVRRGLTQSPEGRRVFGVLTVLENLRLGAFTVGDKERPSRRWTGFLICSPRLHERKDQLAGTLSGGEQQMLAIGRALMGQPKLLLLDEPSLGLAPLLVKSIFETIRAINQSGVTILIVEQNARAALKLATRGYVLELGRVVMEDTAAHLLANQAFRKPISGRRAKPWGGEGPLFQKGPSPSQPPIPLKRLQCGCPVIKVWGTGGPPDGSGGIF